MLLKSLEKAKSINPDIVTNPAQDLKSYYSYIDNASKLIPQQILDVPAVLIRDQILQSICYFYFLIDQPLTELENLGYFNNSLQYYPPFSGWLQHFAQTWGKFLSTSESWTPETYKQFYDDPQFGLQIEWYEAPSNWTTFNEFFSKNLRSPCERPIGCANSPSIVVSPADSEPQGVWPIDENSNINFGKGLTVKLARYYKVGDLLAKDSKYKDIFANGLLTHTFLNVFDYHRYHFAVGGTVIEKKIIQQNVALEVTWSEEEGKYIPIDSEGWQFSQTRGYVIVDTDEFGIVALIPMGMAQVSSVNFEKNVTVGTKHNKGDKLGYFLFGGSDFIMLFQEKAGFEIMVQQNEDMKTYKHILMGVKYGVMKGEK
ncbi:MAG: phosphatidylserine decarboxylase [Bacteroidales bacterium]|nr:phosphatidylserine decarboxylase [Bacteroidales bacterium]